MLRWLEGNTLSVLYGFIVWTVILAPVWRWVRATLRELRDLLDPATAGGLGEIERRLAVVERKLDGER